MIVDLGKDKHRRHARCHTRRFAWFRSWRTSYAPWPSELRCTKGAQQQHQAQQGPVEVAKAQETAQGHGGYGSFCRAGAAAATCAEFPADAVAVRSSRAARVLLARLACGVFRHNAMAVDKEMPALDPCGRAVPVGSALGSRRRPHRTHFNRRRGLLRRQVAREAPLLVHKSRHHFCGDARRVIAESAVLPQHRHHELGIAARRHAHKPDVGISGLALVGFFQRLVTHHLRRFRFCRQSRSLQDAPNSLCGTSPAVSPQPCRW